jgi:hypothetical protein
LDDRMRLWLWETPALGRGCKEIWPDAEAKSLVEEIWSDAEAKGLVEEIWSEAEGKCRGDLVRRLEDAQHRNPKVMLVLQTR